MQNQRWYPHCSLLWFLGPHGGVSAALEKYWLLLLLFKFSVLRALLVQNSSVLLNIFWPWEEHPAAIISVHLMAEKRQTASSFFMVDITAEIMDDNRNTEPRRELCFQWGMHTHCKFLVWQCFLFHQRPITRFPLTQRTQTGFSMVTVKTASLSKGNLR